jgi:hypothetical protein
MAGLQSLTFDKIVHTVAEIHAVFSRALGTGKLEECRIITSYKECQLSSYPTAILLPAKTWRKVVN